MKTYYCKDFKGHCPVPTAAVVMADSIEEARHLIWHALTRRGLPQHEHRFTVHELKRPRRVEILSDGDY